MAEYIDSASQKRSDYIRHWLDKNLLPDTKSFHVQSGYFSYAAVEPYDKVLEGMIKRGGSIKFVLGSNGGSLRAADSRRVLKIVKGKAHCTFTVVAFTNAEFHPKCYYIERSATSATALVGSGNLTSFGTSLNVEAAVILDTDKGDSICLIKRIGDAIGRWETLGENEGAYQVKTVRDIEDLRRSKIIDLGGVEARVPPKKVVRQQKKSRKMLKRGLKRHWSLGKRSTKKAGGPRPVLPVLVAEIPNAGGRWKQANFDKGNFEEFFGLAIGDKTKTLYLQHVDANGSLGPVESRQGVSVKSHNYRLELAAASGLSYPSGSAPIAVFVRTHPSKFRYRLLMPIDPDFVTVSAFLGSNWAGSPGRKQRVVSNTHEVRRAWPRSPLWVKAGMLF